MGLSGLPVSFNRALFRHLADFGLTKSQVWSWAREAKSFKEFVQRIQRHVGDLTGKRVWVEKTPWNIYATRDFLWAFPGAKVIHLVRDPRDTILSLSRRDKDGSLYPAAQN